MGQLHPLFPDKGPLDISWICVTRHESTGQVYHPSKWDPEELQGLEAIHELFGGGVYEFIARDEKGILARHKVKLPGPSKPLSPEVTATPVAAAPVAVSDGGNGMLMQLVLGLLGKSDAQAQAQLASQEKMFMAMSQMFASQAAQQTQFLTALMQDSKRDSQSFVTGMAELAKQQTATMAEAMRAQNNSSGGKDSANDMLEVLTAGMELGARTSEKPNKVAETIGAVVQGIGALKDSKSPNGAAH